MSGSTVDGWNPKQPPGMLNTLEVMGWTPNLNWLAGFQPSESSDLDVNLFVNFAPKW